MNQQNHHFLPIENYSDDNNDTIEDNSGDIFKPTYEPTVVFSTTTTEPYFEPTHYEEEPNDNNSWRNSAQQCVWPQIICREGFIVSLQLLNAEFNTEEFRYEGSIATEIGLLKNLTTLILGMFNCVSILIKEM